VAQLLSVRVQDVAWTGLVVGRFQAEFRGCGTEGRQGVGAAGGQGCRSFARRGWSHDRVAAGEDGHLFACEVVVTNEAGPLTVKPVRTRWACAARLVSHRSVRWGTAHISGCHKGKLLVSRA
jgi:hypothetical protein